MPATISTTPWSNFKESDYTLPQWIKACLIHPPQPTQKKEDYKLPVREPNGTLNKNAVFAVASVLAGGRGGVDATPEQKTSAAVSLMKMYMMMNQEPPASLKAMMHFSVGEAIQHFGVKGMKWGIRKDNSGGAGRRVKPAASEDAIRVNAYKQTAKRGGTNALSTRELQDLVTRMNLEQQYARMKPPSKGSVAAKFVADVLVGAGKQQAAKYANDLLSKQLEKMLKKK